MLHRFAALAATSALGLALLGSVAYADDLPVRGTAACDDAIAAAVPLDVDVIAATKVATPLVELAQLPTATDDQKAAAGEATKVLADVTARVRAALALKLCVAPPVVTTTTAPVALTDDRDCGDFDSQEAAQRYFLEHGTAAQLDPDRLDANSNGIACEGAFDEGAAPTTTVMVTVDPTADDGSVANTSGAQVTVVPEGSAQTGAA